MTSRALKNEFLNYTSSVHISSECKEIDECLKIIPKKNNPKPAVSATKTNADHIYTRIVQAPVGAKP